MTRVNHKVLTWIGGGALLAALIVAVAIAVWPASETDKARQDGEAFGAAVGALYDADNQAEVDAALADIDSAIADTRVHAGDAVADQAAAQDDALSRAAEGFTGYVSADNDWDQALYEAELDEALDDLTDNASDFRAQGPEVRQAFWEGVETGINA
jgi:hypothetical protein